jgi:hypothetical protein|nr:MAG TPA: hypothetical protein [Caudoviricetes sp.]
MIVRSSHIITLPSGNLARDFRWESLGYGRVRVQYNYTDRRRAHQTARRYTVEFLNGKVDSICARSANGGRVEYFKTSTILAELLGMLAEFNEVVHGVAESYRSEPAKVEAPVEQDIVPEDDTTSDTSTDLKDTVELLRGVVMINVIIILVTLGVVWYNL